ncbi:acyltransferase [Avibacterium avium]|uniref:acyltransferase n=1 Tax=Avibacterium avium TaxID=751 RepID=UPI003BF8ADC4
MISYKERFKNAGKNIIFDPISSFFLYKRITLGNYIFIGARAWFSGEIYIGNYVMFGPSVTILGGDHEYKNLEKPMFFIKDNSNRSAPIIIEDDVWIGANVTILKGVTIKQGSIIAAGSVVNKDVEAFSIVGGVPAIKINDRFNMKERKLYSENIKKWMSDNER